MSERQPKESSIKIYEATLNAISKALGHTSIPKNIEWLEDYNKVMDVLNLSNSLHTKKNKLNVIILWMRLHNGKEKIINKYYDDMMKIGSQINSQYMTNEKTDKQNKNWMEKDEILELLNKLKMKIPKEIETYNELKIWLRWFLLHFHMKYPIRNDLADCQIWESDDNINFDQLDKNFIILFKSKPAILILNNYKTNSTYGQKMINLDKDTTKILKQYYKTIIKFSGDHWIVPDRNGDNITRNAYTKRFNEIFKDTGKNISSSMIRHFVVSEVFQPKEGELQKRQLLADVMGHSIMQQQSVYSKV